jgi:hypothetical protein
MTDRQNTIVCVFSHSSPRIAAHQIHDWIYMVLKLPGGNIRMIQIDGPRCHVCIKFHTSEHTYSVLQETWGCVEFKHNTGEISMVYIDMAGMGTRRIRLDNLPPEVSDRTIQEVLTAYGEVKEINKEFWLNAYRYPVSNRIRTAVVHLKKTPPITYCNCRCKGINII